MSEKKTQPKSTHNDDPNRDLVIKDDKKENIQMSDDYGYLSQLNSLHTTGYFLEKTKHTEV